MTKQEYLSSVFETFHSDIDNVFERFKVKWALLSVLRTNGEPVSVTLKDPTLTRTILQINYPAGKINDYYGQMETECRRIFISDIYSTCATFSIYLDNVLREKSVNGRHLPAFSEEKFDQPLSQLNRFLSTGDKEFLNFLHRVRNSMIHYDGQHNKRNSLNYKILNLDFVTTDANLGEQIIWGGEEMIEIYKMVKAIFDINKFQKSPMFK